MYRCKICTTVSEPREPMRKHVIYRRVMTGTRWRQEIAAEIPVCWQCERILEQIKQGIKKLPFARKPEYRNGQAEDEKYPLRQRSNRG